MGLLGECCDIMRRKNDKMDRYTCRGANSSVIIQNLASFIFSTLSIITRQSVDLQKAYTLRFIDDKQICLSLSKMYFSII